MPITIMMFAKAEVRVDWSLWEHLFFEVFSGSFTKKVGTSGNIPSAVERCKVKHNACIPECNTSTAGITCVIEFQDHFPHTMDPYGSVFPRPWPSPGQRWMPLLS